MKKSNINDELVKSENSSQRREIRESHGRLYVTFTDLYEMKQSGLEDALQEHGTVYILSKRMPPLKITLAEIS